MHMRMYLGMGSSTRVFSPMLSLCQERRQHGSKQQRHCTPTHVPCRNWIAGRAGSSYCVGSERRYSHYSKNGVLPSTSCQLANGSILKLDFVHTTLPRRPAEELSSHMIFIPKEIKGVNRCLSPPAVVASILFCRLRLARRRAGSGRSYRAQGQN